MLKKVTESIAIFSIAILILGLIKQYLFYLRFDVPIKYFLNISEIGLIVSDDLLIMSSVFGLFFLIVYVTSKPKIPWEEEKKIIEERERLMSNLKETHKKSYNKIVISRIAMIALLMICGLLICILSKDYTMKMLGFSLLLLMIPYGILTFYPHTLYRHLTGVQSSIYISFAIFVIIYITVIGVQVSRVENGKYFGTIIKATDTTYISTKDSYFIGKTEKYVFVYNAKDTTTSIIPSDKIETIILKQK